MGDRDCLVIQFTSACQVLLGFRTVALELGAASSAESCRCTGARTQCSSLRGRSKHDALWHPMFLISPMTWVLAPSVFASRAVIEVLACSWLYSLRSFARADPCCWVGSFTRCGSALLFLLHVLIPAALFPATSSSQSSSFFASASTMLRLARVEAYDTGALCFRFAFGSVAVLYRCRIFFSSTQSACFTQVLTVLVCPSRSSRLCFASSCPPAPHVLTHVFTWSPNPQPHSAGLTSIALRKTPPPRARLLWFTALTSPSTSGPLSQRA